ncbi:hypothetical protein Nepgr_014274 [Nepenthes gracilis]|uniref:Uncharacterized protein n=1 Tax=Nepenthes gracilis TaxID=150966 RepID=A0AAD3XPP8_NEPGR|nr:hypothetical protein Nepgr_014274 [Nepenthes gracilis]
MCCCIQSNHSHGVSMQIYPLNGGRPSRLFQVTMAGLDSLRFAGSPHALEYPWYTVNCTKVSLSIPHQEQLAKTFDELQQNS